MYDNLKKWLLTSRYLLQVLKDVDQDLKKENRTKMGNCEYLCGNIWLPFVRKIELNDILNDQGKEK